MFGFLIRWLINTLALVIVVLMVPGIHAQYGETVVLAALVLGFLNAFLRPVIILLTLPLHVMSLGFFTLVVNGLMLYAVSKIVEGFYVANFWSAFFGALFFSIISFVLGLFIDPHGKINIHFRQQKFSGSRPSDDIIDIEGEEKDEPPSKPPRIPDL